jgi:hypothetical protein
VPAWQAKLQGAPVCAPRVDDGGEAVLIASSSALLDTAGLLQALHEATGELLWAHPAVDDQGTA